MFPPNTPGPSSPPEKTQLWSLHFAFIEILTGCGNKASYPRLGGDTGFQLALNQVLSINWSPLSSPHNLHQGPLGGEGPGPDPTSFLPRPVLHCDPRSWKWDFLP